MRALPLASCVVIFQAFLNESVVASRHSVIDEETELTLKRGPKKKKKAQTKKTKIKSKASLPVITIDDMAVHAMNVRELAGALHRLELSKEEYLETKGQVEAQVAELDDFGSKLTEFHAAANDLLDMLRWTEGALNPALAAALAEKHPFDLEAVIDHLDAQLKLVENKSQDVYHHRALLENFFQKEGVKRDDRVVPPDMSPKLMASTGSALWELDMLHVTFVGATSRAQRLLTPGAPPTISAHKRSEIDILTTPPAPEYAKEDTLDFLRAFVRVNLDATWLFPEQTSEDIGVLDHSVSDLQSVHQEPKALLMYRRLKRVGLETMHGGSPASFKKLLNEEAGVEEPDAEWFGQMRRLHHLLQERGAFGFPKLFAKGNLDLASHAKKKWAMYAAALPAALDITTPFFDIKEEEKEVVLFTPRVCSYINTAVSYPIMGGNVPHTFIVYTGWAEEDPRQGNCVEIAQEMANLFPKLGRGGRSLSQEHKQYLSRRKRGAEAGCANLERWGKISNIFESAETSLAQELDQKHFHLRVELKDGSAKEVELEFGNPEDGGSILAALSSWAQSTLIRYATKDPDHFWHGAKESMKRSNPYIEPAHITNFTEGKFTELGIEAGTWAKAKVQGETLDAVYKYVDAAKSAARRALRRENTAAALSVSFAQPMVSETVMVANSSDDEDASLNAMVWPLLAQTPALYQSTDFSGAGVGEAGWAESGCHVPQNQKSCAVQPQCARAATQMVSYPFGGFMGYAKGTAGKVRTWLSTSSWTQTSSFDKDGFHSYCHSPGEAYCWSYTFCVEEMMKWLCSQPETADACCPNLATREACAIDVNSGACQVCVSETGGEDLEHYKFTRREAPPEKMYEFFKPEEEEGDTALDDPCALIQQLVDETPSEREPMWMLVQMKCDSQKLEKACWDKCFPGVEYNDKEKKKKQYEGCKGWQEKCAE